MPQQKPIIVPVRLHPNPKFILSPIQRYSLQTQFVQSKHQPLKYRSSMELIRMS
jgi:hypothetical protein